MNPHAQLVLSVVALLGFTALATIAPFLDDIIRGLTLGGGIDTTVAYHRYQRTGRDSFPLIAWWTIVGAFLAARVVAGYRTTIPVNFRPRTLLAFLVAFVLGVPSILIALQLGASGWGLTAATIPAMLIASLVAHRSSNRGRAFFLDEDVESVGHVVRTTPAHSWPARLAVRSRTWTRRRSAVRISPDQPIMRLSHGSDVLRLRWRGEVEHEQQRAICRFVAEMVYRGRSRSPEPMVRIDD